MSTMNNSHVDETQTTDKPSIPKLLSALAAAARASNTLPLSIPKNQINKQNKNNVKNNEEIHNDSIDEDLDEFAYQWTFPQFANGICEARSTVLNIIGECLHAHDEDFDESCLEQINVEFDWDDKEILIASSGSSSGGGIGINVWNECYDCQESLLDGVERYLQDRHDEQTNSNMPNTSSTFSPVRNKYGGGLSHVISNTVEMEKPQLKYNFNYDNSRTQVWVPPYMKKEDLPPLLQGHGLNHRNNSEIESTIMAPSMHYSHPFQNIIESFKYTTEQLNPPKMDQSKAISSTLNKPMNPAKTCHFIQTKQGLSDLSILMKKLNITQMAVDLEHHSYRSFHGFTCLMQISFRVPNETETKSTTTQTYLIDTIELRPSIHNYLSYFFQSSQIVKVMHGANSDVKWLQRDFGIYIVNLFDTSIASRLLKLPSASLAYLLKKYAGLTEIDSWKLKYQLGDWRVRPLEDGMLLYAMGDTHYLLDVYDVLRLELVQKSGGDNQNETTNENQEVKHEKNQSSKNPPPVISIRSVLDASRKICLIHYKKEPFYPDGYQRLLSNRKSDKRKKKKMSKVQSRLTPVQTAILASLWDWRDSTARELDESIVYICNDKALMRIAMAMPVSVTVLQGLLNPMPVIIMRYAQQVLDFVKKAKNDGGASDRKNDSAKISVSANKSTMIDDATKTNDGTNREMNKSQYSFHFDNEEQENESLEYLETNACNSNFSSFQYTNHSIEMGDLQMNGRDQNRLRSQTVDGLGAARLVFLNKEQNTTTNQNLNQSVEQEVEQARISAIKVRRNLAIIKKWNQNAWMVGEGRKQKDDGEHYEEKETVNETQEKYEMPKSIREKFGNYTKKRFGEPSNNDAPSNSSKKKKKTESSNSNKGAQEKTVGKPSSDKNSVIPYDYSQTKSINLLDPTPGMSNNPFFSGAALKLGTTISKDEASRARGAKEKNGKAKGDGKEKRKSPKGERPKRRDPNKMMVYKP